MTNAINFDYGTVLNIVTRFVHCHTYVILISANTKKGCSSIQAIVRIHYHNNTAHDDSPFIAEYKWLQVEVNDITCLFTHKFFTLSLKRLCENHKRTY